MTADDEIPDSDPYCAHMLSIYDDEQADPVEHPPCERCGHPCTEHPALWGGWCQRCESCRYVSATQPLG